MSDLLVPDFTWFEDAPEPMAVLAPDGSVTWANAAFGRVFRHAIGPRRAPWGRVVPPPFEGDVRRFEAPTPDGRRFEWVQREMAGGQSLVMARDVSTRIAAAEEAARAKTLLFATLTHELRTPLNGVLGMAALLNGAKLEPAEREYLRAIQQSGEHLLDLITEILDYSRLEAGRLRLESTPFSPEDVMQSVAELLSHKAHEKGLDLVSVPSPAMARAYMGDEGRVRQILFNLAGNAVKFTEKGGIMLGVSRRADGALRFLVRDTGPGIPTDKQERIFEEFLQADDSISRRYGGAGLGLSIVRRLASAMGGRVGVDSRPGAGSSFWVDLPLAEAAPPSAAQVPCVPARVAVLASGSILRDGAAALVRSVGGVAEVSADLALPRLEGGCDAVLVDHGLLAQMSSAGLEAFVAAVPPIIVMLTPEDRGRLDHYRAFGASRYLIKPLRRRSLAEQLGLVLSGKAPVEAQAAHAAPSDDRLAPLSLSGLHVLMADDNPVNALLARTVLTRAGANVTVAADGEEAVSAFQRAGPFDLVLLDLRMPRLDGLGAARRIRSLSPEGARVPLIALTAETSADDRAAALAAGMNDFVTKPIAPAALAALAGRYLGTRFAQSA